MVKPEATLMSLTHIYMTDPFPLTSIKSGGLKSVLWSQTFFFINYKSYKMKNRDIYWIMLSNVFGFCWFFFNLFIYLFILFFYKGKY
jgi:hypothetical protein